MNKLLVSNYSDIMLFDLDNNAILNTPYRSNCIAAFIADKEGLAISESEVVDYNAGDLVIILSCYSIKQKKLLHKFIVCNDVVAKQDIIEWQNTFKEDDETV